MNKVFVFLGCLAAGCGWAGLAECAAGVRPNILLILADDLGFADLGCYGSEIATPNLDRLARQGVRFSAFHNTAKCETSRISLLTGLYPYQAGYRALDRAVTVAELLREAGYFTSMAGKWHLEKEPTDRGFQRYWGHLSGATDFFAGDETFRLNGAPWREFGPEFYTTDANVDFSIRFLEEALATGKPFFHYVAFNAPHYPLQAPREDVEKYRGRYDRGWDAARAARFARQKELGLWPAEATLPPRPEHVPAWESLPEGQRRFESFRMAVFAAMVDRLDRNVGRLVQFLEEKGQLENTLILFLSDNGGCPFERSSHLELPPWQAGSHLLYDASWATVSNTPLRHYKQTQHEGGTSSPLIAHWPAGIRAEAGSWVRPPAHLVDILATCIDYADTDYPAESGGRKVAPRQGRSLRPLLEGGNWGEERALYFQFSTCRAVRQGDWKLVSFYGARWELYNLARDRGEQQDLAAAEPARVEAMARSWHIWAEETEGLAARLREPAGPDASPEAREDWHQPEVWKSWTAPPGW